MVRTRGSNEWMICGHIIQSSTVPCHNPSWSRGMCGARGTCTNTLNCYMLAEWSCWLVWPMLSVYDIASRCLARLMSLNSGIVQRAAGMADTQTTTETTGRSWLPLPITAALHYRQCPSIFHAFTTSTPREPATRMVMNTFPEKMVDFFINNPTPVKFKVECGNGKMFVKDSSSGACEAKKRKQFVLTFPFLLLEPQFN